MNTRTLVLVLLVGLLLALLAGCFPVTAPAPTASQPPAAAEAPAQPAPAEPIKLRFWNYWDGKNGETIQALVDRYNAEHPEVEIENTFIGWGELLPKLQTATAGGDMPDIAAADMAWMPKLAGSDALVELDAYIQASGVDTGDWYPALLGIDQYSGKTLGLPVSTNNLELIYNRDLFKEVGLDPEQPPTTWAGLMAMAQQCSAADGSRFGMELFTQPGEGLTWQFQVYLWQAGGDFLTPDNSAAAFNSAAGEQALQFWVDLIEAKAAPLAPWGLFGQGKVCMVMDGSWMVGIWRDQSPFDFGTAVMPIPEGGEPATNMGGEHIFLFKTTPDKQQAAWEFVNWLTSTPIQIEWDMATGFMPVRKSVAEDPTYRQWLSDTEPRLIPFVDSQQYAHARPSIASYPEISDAFSRELEKALYGQVTVKEALEAAQAAVDEILAGQ